eukprot:scaffold43698_cov49-Prasinocladus_malaysianus.AAC.1
MATNIFHSSPPSSSASSISENSTIDFCCLLLSICNRLSCSGRGESIRYRRLMKSIVKYEYLGTKTHRYFLATVATVLAPSAPGFGRRSDADQDNPYHSSDFGLRTRLFARCTVLSLGEISLMREVARHEY